MKITSWNIQHGEVYSPGQAIDRTAEIKRTLTSLNPDVLMLQEVDHLDDRSNREHQSKDFAEIIDASFWAFAPSVWRKDDGWLDWPMGTSEKFPALITNESQSIEPCYGIAIASRIPIIKWERRELPKALVGWWLPTTIDGVTRKYWVNDHARTALAAYLPDGTVLINTHLSWEPIFRHIQLARLKSWANSIARDKSLNVMIIGDLNIPISWEESVESLRWKSRARQLTFPVWKPDCQIDHFLTRPGVKVTLEPLVESRISDHLPISIRI